MEIKLNKQIIRSLFIICMVTVLAGQFYISPFDIGFRMSLAVFFLSLFLLYFNEYDAFSVSLLVGVLMIVFRTLVSYVGNNLIISESVAHYVPVIFFYIFYGLFFKILEVREYLDRPFNFIMSLWVCDSVSNIIEASVRKVWMISSFDKLIISIIIIGGIRSLLTYVVYAASKYYVNKFKTNEREKYYRELILFISRLKTELFLLKKSRTEIENTVSFIHEYYNNTEDEEIKGPLLKIAKDIHEIKKDYLRVIAGMDSIFKSEASHNYMSIKEILFIIKDNMTKLVFQQNKRIVITTKYNEMFTTKEYYIIVSILNNLTINSMDAIEKFGNIEIICEVSKESVVFIVKDDGEGIPDEKKEVVFSTGYTTKYDKVTGQMSTGIGLSHVKQIVDTYLKGKIQVNSKVNEGTEIIIKIPKNNILGGSI